MDEASERRGPAVSAHMIVAKVRGSGRSIRLDGADLVIRPRMPPELLAEVRAHKAEIVALLEAERQAKVAVSDAIRERRYPLPEPKVCDFLIGHAGGKCRRCGGSWFDHYSFGEKAKRPGDEAS